MKPQEENVEPGSKNIYIATSAMTVGVKQQDDGSYLATPKSGSLGYFKSLIAP